MFSYSRLNSYPNNFPSFFPFKVSIDIYKYDIVADSPDAFPRDDKVILSPEKPKKAAWARYNNCKDAACEGVDEHIADKSHSKAVMYVDDLLTPEIGNPALHIAPSIRYQTFPASNLFT
jgi:hypothetical protein